MNEQKLEQEMTRLHTMVRLGTVSSVDTENRMARVTFPAMGFVSGTLKVLKTGRDSNGDYYMPSVGAEVLCLYLPVKDGDGFVLGGV